MLNNLARECKGGEGFLWNSVLVSGAHFTLGEWCSLYHKRAFLNLIGMSGTD